MKQTIDYKKRAQNSKTLEEKAKRVTRDKQNQTDPQLTELKGFIDPNEKLEPDNEKEISNDDKE
jgi:hypothetical protein